MPARKHTPYTVQQCLSVLLACSCCRSLVIANSDHSQIISTTPSHSPTTPSHITSFHQPEHHVQRTYTMSRYPSLFTGTSGQHGGLGTSNNGTSHAHAVQQQSSALMSHFPNCRAVRPDRSMLELPFHMQNGRKITLHIALLQGFPQERPLITVAEPLVHPWVGFGGQLDYPSLRGWTPASSLVKVVQDAYMGLGGRPPSPPTATQTTTSTSAHRPAIASPPTQAAPPAVPSSTSSTGMDFAALLENIPTEQLATAAHDNEAFEALFQQLLAAQQHDEGAEIVRNQHARLVEQSQTNLQREAALNDVRNQIAVIRSADSGSVAQFNARRARVQEMIAPVAPNVLISTLQAAAQQTEAESEQVVRQFITGQLPVDDFVAQYGDLRTLYHKRDLKRQAAVASKLR